MCNFNLVIRRRMQSWLKGQSHIWKITLIVQKESMSNVITIYKAQQNPVDIWSDILPYMYITLDCVNPSFYGLVLRCNPQLWWAHG